MDDDALLTTATAAIAATAVETATSTVPAAHNGIPPAAAMPTPFDFPCGVNFLSNDFHKNKNLRNRCGPPNFDAYWWSTAGYYSPALCPRGYTAGCFRWNSEQGPPVEATETAIQCVPRGYKCKNNDISVAFSGTATAPMIQIRWASTDLSTFATHPLYPGANPTNTEEDYLSLHSRTAGLKGRAGSSGYAGGSDYPTSYSSSSSQSSGTSPSSTAGPGGSSNSGGDSGNDFSSGGGGGGLSTAAKAGIGIGVSLSALIGFTILGIILWRIKKAKDRSRWNAQPPQMVQSQYATQPGGPQSSAPGGGGPVPMGGVSPEQYYGGQAGVPQQPRPVYQQHQNGQPQQQHQYYPPPNASEMDSSTVATSTWTNTMTPSPPPAAAMATDRGIHGVVAAHPPPPPHPKGVAASGIIDSPQAPASELESTRTPNPPVEIGSGSPAVRYTQPVMVTEDHQHEYQQQPRSELADPQSFVVAPPVEPSAEELSRLRDQHAQLEQRRLRIMELERIEQEQEALRGRMSEMEGGGGSK